MKPFPHWRKSCGIVRKGRLVSGSYKIKGGPATGPPFIFDNVTIGSGQVKTVKVHHLAPCGYKIVHKLFFGIGKGIYLGNGP